MQGHKNFWDKNAGRYDRFMRKDRAAYDEMYELIRPVVCQDGKQLATARIDRKTHRKRGGAHRGDRRLCGDDRRGKARYPFAKLHAGYVPPALCEPVL